MQKVSSGDAATILVTNTDGSARRSLRDHSPWSAVTLEGEQGTQNFGETTSFVPYDPRHTGHKFVIKGGPVKSTALVMRKVAIWAPFQRLERVWETNMGPYFDIEDGSVVCFTDTCVLQPGMLVQYAGNVCTANGPFLVASLIQYARTCCTFLTHDSQLQRLHAWCFSF